MQQESYQMISEKGDVVRMPNGTIGIINHRDIVRAGHCKEVRVYPFTNWIHRLYLVLTGKIWFYDQQINQLQPIYLTPRK